jgi:hypothetical protein
MSWTLRSSSGKRSRKDLAIGAAEVQSALTPDPYSMAREWPRGHRGKLTAKSFAKRNFALMQLT